VYLAATMIFDPLPVAGAYLISPQKRTGERGYFARVFCRDEFEVRGLCADYCQANTALSPLGGTLRGLHLQRAPHGEVKLIRCTRGRVFDVVLDLRRESPTYLRWHGAELSADNAAMLYAPEGTAHGYLTLSDDTELLYMTSAKYAPEAATGVRFDDRAFGIRWPRDIALVSQADLAWADFQAGHSINP
jgi:dTDP-4-dehydrorhamnose 3,5-epimerase